MPGVREMPGPERAGTGLSLQGNTTGSVAYCEALRNGFHGILIGGQAQPTLKTNICRDNRGSGIFVTHQVQPTLEGNTCENNLETGIEYQLSAAGIARRNICTDNRSASIRVLDQAYPTLEANICTRNGSDDRYVVSTARPIIKDEKRPSTTDDIESIDFATFMLHYGTDPRPRTDGSTSYYWRQSGRCRSERCLPVQGQPERCLPDLCQLQRCRPEQR
jgi:parallel beta-helix repeat protein